MTPLGGSASARRALAAVAVLAAAVVAVGPAATTARADGDPPSDVLLLQNVYFPYRLPSAAARAELQHAADAVYARGDRVRVALIFTMDDLGSIPSMFGQPTEGTPTFWVWSSGSGTSGPCSWSCRPASASRTGAARPPPRNECYVPSPSPLRAPTSSLGARQPRSSASLERMPFAPRMSPHRS